MNDYDALLERACSKIETKAEEKARLKREREDLKKQKELDEMIRLFGVDGKMPSCQFYRAGCKAIDEKIKHVLAGTVYLGHLNFIKAQVALSPGTYPCGYGIGGSGIHVLHLAQYYCPPGAMLTAWEIETDMLSCRCCLSFKFESDKTLKELGLE